MDRPWEGKSIVVVDDSTAARNELRDHYTSLGLNVVGEATNGEEALAVVNDKTPDFVSLDIIMPVMDGIECYKKLQKAPGPKPLCFFVSALAGEHRVTECYAESIGVEKFQPKPVTRADLEQRLTILTGAAQVAAVSLEPQP